MMPLLKIVLVAVTLGSVSGSHAAEQSGATLAPMSASITVSTPSQPRVVPRSFLGISTEYYTLPSYVGQSSRNPLFPRLLRQLGAHEGAPLRLRVGGRSADMTWLKGGPVPSFRTDAIGQPWEAGLAWVLRASGARALLDLNLAGDSTGRVAEGEAREFSHRLGPGLLDGFELGNEPDSYPIIPLSQDRLARSAGYGPLDYSREIQPVVDSFPDANFIEGELGGHKWFHDLAPALRRHPGNVGAFSIHIYPLINCRRGHPPTLERLLSPAALNNVRKATLRGVSLARRYGLPTLVTELNSVACGGTYGVSDTFGSALWTVGALFAALQEGASGVELHTLNRASYHLFVFKQRGQGGWQAQVFPDYYGALLFSEAAPAGANVLSVKNSAQNADVGAYATDDGDCVRTVLDNLRTDADVNAAIRLPTGVSAGFVTRLTAPSVWATSSIQLGGQSFGAGGTQLARGDVTTTARLAGPGDPAPAGHGAGVFRVRVPAGSAALVESPRHPGGCNQS